jgi:hypothetical protein
MSTAAELDRAYAEWRRLAEAEGRAIRSGNWKFVAECQQALCQLRPQIDDLTSQLRQQIPSSDPPTCPRKQLTRSTILELIELQRRNLISLEQRRARLSAHIENLMRSGRNLREIQRSYAAPTIAVFNSYS